MDHSVAFSESTYEALRSHLLAHAAQEEAAFVLGRAVRFSGGQRFVVSEVIPVPPEAFEAREELGLQISAVFANRILKRARLEEKGIMLCHSHPFSKGGVEFSGVDDWGDSRLLPAFAMHLEQPVGSLVMGSDCARARFLGTDGALEVANRVVVTGTGVVVVRPERRRKPGTSHGAHARQLLAFGEQGQESLRAARVAVVGLGGTGSYVADYLSRLGVAHLILVDPDDLELSNVSRVANSTPADVGRPKVEIAREAILKVNPRAVVGSIGDSVTRMSMGIELAGSDIVFCCTDNHASRAVLSQMAYEFCLRVIDLGTQIVVRDGAVARIAGKVVRLGPGYPCLWCAEDINAGRIADEALPAAARAALAKEGYVKGADVKEPAVVSYNAAVAALAVSELVRDLTGVGGADAPMRLVYDALTGTVRRASLPRRVECVCTQAEARGLPQELPWLSRAATFPEPPSA